MTSIKKTRSFEALKLPSQLRLGLLRGASQTRMALSDCYASLKETARPVTQQQLAMMIQPFNHLRLRTELKEIESSC